MAPPEGGKITPISSNIVARVAGTLTNAVSGAIRGASQAWMGPQQPLVPSANPSPKGRAWDYQPGFNLNIQPRPYEPTSFEELRGLAESCDIVRLLIETRKDQMVALPWDIVAKADRGRKVKKDSENDPRIDALRTFFRRPDRVHDWAQWLRMILEDMLVIDAATLYRRRTKGGQLYSLMPMDGATIALKIDESGLLPEAPEPAYQQILHGTAAADYSQAELLYLPRNPRTHDIYGYSPVEQIIITINTLIRRIISQMNYYTDGNIPAGLMPLPADWTPQDIETFTKALDARLSGNLAERQKLIPVPNGTSIEEVKTPPQVDLADEWFTRICCFCFSISPQPFVKEMNRATAETSRQQALAEGLTPIMLWVKAFMDRVLEEDFDAADLEFKWLDDKEQDAKTQAEVHQIYANAKVLTRNEIRADLGRDPVEGGDEFEQPQEPDGFDGTGYDPGDDDDGDDDEDERPTKKKARKMTKGGGKRIHVPFDRPALHNARAGLQDQVARILANVGRTLAASIRGEKMAKASPGDDIDLSGLRALVDAVPAYLEAVGKDAGAEVISQLGVTDEFSLVNQIDKLAVDYAYDRAAEMVGMRWNDQGQLVPARRAAWRIDKTTRAEVRRIIAEGLRDNIGRDAIADAIEKSEAFSAERAMTIANTEIAMANSASVLNTYDLMEDEGFVVEKRWHPDAEACPVCIANAKQGPVPNGKPFASGDMAPPAHPNCFLEGTAVSAFGVTKSYKRWFNGKIVRISAAGVDDISVTPNHPILTNRGWVGAGFLKRGDMLLKLKQREEVSLVAPEHNHIEASIENVSDALIMTGGVPAKPMVLSAEDFHGDGSVNENVHVVRTTSDLTSDIIGEIETEVFENLFLPRAHLRRFILATRRSLAQLVKAGLPSSDGIMSGGNSSLPISGGSSAGLDAARIASAPDGETNGLEISSQSGGMDTDSACYIDARLPSLIEFVEVLDVTVGEFSGHVYNLETVDGWYIANSVIVSNCECVVVSEVTRPDEE